MNNEDSKQCKKKGCFNPVINGRYCENCKQKSKETRNKILAVTVGTTILGGGASLKKVGIKQAPKIAAKVIKEIFKV